jgi:hypothetical protein
MGASDSKLSFKQGIFRLSEPKQIPADDVYWTGVCCLLYTAFAVLTTAPVLGAARVR